MDKNKSWKKKSAALTLAVSMVLTNPLALTGCSNNHVSQQQQQEEDKEEENQGQSTYYRSHSPFIFTNSTSSGGGAAGSSFKSKTSNGWHAWTTPNSDGGYSGVHSGSVSA